MFNDKYEYKILTSGYPEKLSEEVTSYLNKDWHLIGGVSVSLDNHILTYCQAVVKYPANIICRDQID